MALCRLTDWVRKQLRNAATRRNQQRMARSPEVFESRALLAVTISFDYSKDANGFFSDASRKTVLEAAATQLTQRFNDTLSAITPSAGNTWTATFNHPATGASTSVSNPTIPADTIIVYAGGRNLGSTLGIGGPGGFSISFTSTTFRDAVQGRGEPGALTTPKTDFGPWGGSITFNTTTNWHFGTTTTGLDAGEADFFSVAMHELGHLLGIGTAASWDAQVSGGTFTGAASQAEFDLGGPVPLDGDDSHWEDGTTDGGVETAMDPIITIGTRKVFTELDFAALDDVGWEVTAPPTSFQRTFTLSAGVTHTVVLSDSGTSNDGNSQIVIDGVTTVFANPSNSLIIEGGNLADSITIIGLDDGFAASITINGNDGDDSITINSDLGAGNAVNGGIGTDSLTVNGSNASSVGFTYASTTSGTIAVDTATVTLSNFESLSDKIISAARSITTLSTAETMTLGDDGVTTGVSRLSGASIGMPINFANPTSSLTLNAGLGNDVITVGPLDSTLAAAITINGEGNNDSISAAGISLPVTLNAGNGINTLVGGNGNDTLVGGLFEDTLTGGPGADNLDPGAGADTLIEAGDLNYTLTQTTLTTTPPGSATTTFDTITGFDFVSLTGGSSGNTIDVSGFTPTTSVGPTIIGGGGRDSIVGSTKADSINCSASVVQVTVNSGSGADTITTGSHNDRIDGGGGNDSIISGAGDDTIFGSAGLDTIDGGAGADNIYGLNDADSIIGGDGDDRIQGGAGNDVINAGAGADRVFGGTENDSILGGAGADSLFGDTGDDTVLGEGDNDQISGYAGTDSLDGGPGVDRVSESADANVVIVGTTMTSTFLGNETHAGIERYNLNGGAGANLIDARQSSVFAIINGNEGNDTLLGTPFADQIFGGTGTDVISGGAGIDLIDGGDSLNDVFYEKADGNFVLGATTVQSTATGNETLLNIEKYVIVGGAGNNLIDATNAGRTVTLLGGAGNDTLIGGAFADVLVGGSRSDTNGGTDSLNGGAARDTYDNDPADTRVVSLDTESSGATIFASLPSWIDSI